MKNYYKLLGVSENESTENIKKAYRKLAKQYHPDLHPDDPKMEDKFKEINEAWETLSDETKRKTYDSERSNSTDNTGKKKTSGKRTAPVGNVDFEEMMKDFSGIFTKENIKAEHEKKTGAKDPFNSDEMFKKFMGFD